MFSIPSSSLIQYLVHMLLPSVHLLLVVLVGLEHMAGVSINHVFIFNLKHFYLEQRQSLKASNNVVIDSISWRSPNIVPGRTVVAVVVAAGAAVHSKPVPLHTAGSLQIVFFIKETVGKIK